MWQHTHSHTHTHTGRRGDIGGKGCKEEKGNEIGGGTITCILSLLTAGIRNLIS